jgi:hypothetical protein
LGETLSESKPNGFTFISSLLQFLGNRPTALNNQSLSGPIQVLSPSKSHSTLRVDKVLFQRIFNLKKKRDLLTL